MQCRPSKAVKGVALAVLCLVACRAPALSGESWDKDVAVSECVSRFILDSGARQNSLIQESFSAWLSGKIGGETILCREVAIANPKYLLFWPDITSRIGIHFFEEMDGRITEFVESEIIAAMRDLEDIYAAPVLLPFDFLLTYREVPSAHLPDAVQAVQRECLFSMGPDGVGGFSMNYNAVICFPRSTFTSMHGDSRERAALRRVIRHEIFHIAQSQILLTEENPSRYYQSSWGPHWLWEGSAMYFSDIGGGLCDKDLTISLYSAIGRSNLDDYAEPQDGNKRSDAAYFAGLYSVCRIRDHSEASSLGSFYRMTAASGSWENGFRYAFGRDYEEFKASIIFGEQGEVSPAP